MNCPFCGNLEDRVVDSRESREGDVIRRRRECLKCERRFTSYERIDEIPYMVVKKDGTRAPFSSVRIPPCRRISVPGSRTSFGPRSLGHRISRCLPDHCRSDDPRTDDGAGPGALPVRREVLGDAEKRVRGMRCQKMELGEPDSSGRRRPLPIAGSEFEFACDSVVYAIGTNANPILGQTSKLNLNKWGYIAADDSLATSIAGVWAGGDIVTGAATVIQAMGAGRRAARAMKAYLGLRDSSSVYDAGAEGSLFGIPRAEHGLAKIRVA